jgi:hypothetical protein
MTEHHLGVSKGGALLCFASPSPAELGVLKGGIAMLHPLHL